MPAWLGVIFKWILEWSWGKLMAVYSAYKKDKENHEKAVNQAAQDSKKAKELKPDSTAKEVDEAIDDGFHHL